MSNVKQTIFEIVRANTLKVLPDLSVTDITIDKNLTDLGANSVDRVEIVLYSLDDLNLKIPISELHGIRDLTTLVDLLYRHTTANQA
jgi:polyketide biosynthesis acyl carrier protein